MTQQIKIPQDLYERLQAHMQNSVFTSFDELIAFALQDFLDRQAPAAEDADKVIRERLKNLGYL